MILKLDYILSVDVVVKERKDLAMMTSVELCNMINFEIVTLIS